MSSLQGVTKHLYVDQKSGNEHIKNISTATSSSLPHNNFHQNKKTKHYNVI